MYRLVAQNGRPGIEGGKLDVQPTNRCAPSWRISLMPSGIDESRASAAGPGEMRWSLRRGWPRRWRLRRNCE